MNRLQFLLNLLAEECTEVGQRASKAIRFGLNEVQKGQDLDNKERLHLELTDLVAVVLLLNNEFDFNFDFDELDWSAINAKHEKIEKFYEYSKKCGMIHEEKVEKDFKLEDVNPCLLVNYNDEEYTSLLRSYIRNPSDFKTRYIDLANSNAPHASLILSKMFKVLKDNGDTVL